MGSIFISGLRDQYFGENGAQGSKLRQDNRDQWVPDIPCYGPEIILEVICNCFYINCFSNFDNRFSNCLNFFI